MSGPLGGSSPVPGASERLSAVQFQEALRHAARFGSRSLVGDPLDAAVKRIEKNPAFSQSRLLARMLFALANESGEFRRAEVAAFDSETLAVVIGLMDARAAGTSTREDWTRAVNAATAAGAIA